MDTNIYPAIFHKQDNGYWVEFPDVPECLTEGDTLEQALLMAGDALYCCMLDREDRPKPTALDQIQHEEQDIVQMVVANPYISDEAQVYQIKEAIEEGLKERKLNKNQAATILDIDRSYFTHMVNGQKIPSEDMAKRIALLLNFDWTIFFQGHHADITK